MPLKRNEFLPQSILTVYSSPSGMTDIRTGLPYYAGGLVLGDYFDLTEAEANALSGGQLHAGRYRFVQVDSGATAANIKQGTICGIPAGHSLQNVVLVTAGSGQTAGTYTVAASGGGGSGATIQVVVGTGGTVTSVSVLTPGSGYTSVPTFTLVTGGTVGTVAAQMSYTVNAVTSYDQAVGLITRGVFLAAVSSSQVSSGAWVFIQEAGEAEVLGNATIGSGAAVGGVVNAVSGGAGTVNAGSANVFNTTTIGAALDAPVASALFRVQIDLPVYAG